MFFFANYMWQNILIGFAVLAGLILVNDLAWRSKWLSLAVYIVLLLVLTFTVWSKTAVRGNGDWFPVVKTYSALAGVIGFMVIRYIKGADIKKWVRRAPHAAPPGRTGPRTVRSDRWRLDSWSSLILISGGGQHGCHGLGWIAVGDQGLPHQNRIRTGGV